MCKYRLRTAWLVLQGNFSPMLLLGMTRNLQLSRISSFPWTFFTGYPFPLAHMNNLYPSPVSGITSDCGRKYIISGGSGADGEEHPLQVRILVMHPSHPENRRICPSSCGKLCSRFKHETRGYTQNMKDILVPRNNPKMEWVTCDSDCKHILRNGGTFWGPF